MALVKTERDKITWNSIRLQHVKHKLPKISKSPVIDYHHLQWLGNLISIQGPKDSPLQEKETHGIFMQNYRKVFVLQQGTSGCGHKTEKSVLSVTEHLQNRIKDARKTCHTAKNVLPPKENTHNIKDYLRLLHKERKNDDLELVKRENLQTLQHILRKRPFERTSGDNEKIFSILKTIDFFREKVNLAMLKQLCTVAYMETLKEENLYVYGKTGIHLIMNGSVHPLSVPYILPENEVTYPHTFLSLEESESTSHNLLPGNCFGTWLIHGHQYTKEFCVQTKEANCEFMKISASDYKLIVAKMKHRERSEKVTLLVSCDQYRLWPRQQLIAVADCIEWISYPSNTVLVKEGGKCPFIGFIKSGECHVLKRVHILTDRNKGKQRTKQIVVGRLGPFDSFAEMSLLLNEPITCTIVTATLVDLGIIRPEKITNLDDVTRQLFIQTSARTFGYLTKEDIQNKYLQQELAMKWNQFKCTQVIEVINANSGCR